MSFVFRGSRADIEAGGFPGFAPERRTMRIHAGSRPVNNNSLAFLLTVLILFMVLNSHQMSPNLLIWLVLGVFLMVTSLRMYATCQQLAHAAAANSYLGHTELRLHVPPTIALATRGRLQSLRLQLALLDREFDDLDYDTLRALDADNSPHAPSMSEEEINSLPVFKYKSQAQRENASAQKSDGASQLSVSLTGAGNEKKQDGLKADGTSKTPEDELTCSVCLEQVVVGDLLRSLPCLHQEPHVSKQQYRPGITSEIGLMGNRGGIPTPESATPQCHTTGFLYSRVVSRKLHRPMAAPTGYMPNLQAPGE